VSDSSIACALAATIRSSMPAIAVRLASLESAPFAFTMTDVTGDLPRHAVGLRNKGATVELISYDAVAATADLLAVFPIGPIDYGLSAVDAATQHMFVVNYDEANRANITTLGITPSTRAILATHAIRLEGTLPSGNLPAMEHAVVVNLEFDKGSKRLVAALAGRGCSDTWIVSLDPTSGIAVPLGAFNGSVSTHLTAIDPFSKTYFVVLEAAQQQLVSFSIDESHGLSPCEQAGGKCQAMQDSRECIYDAPILTEASNAAAEAVCAGLNVSCDFVEWSQQAGGFVMFRRNVPGETCKQPRVLYGPVLGDVRAMTLDMQTRQLMVVREDSSGELRQIADENFQVLQLDIAPITSSIPNIYRRVVSRRLLAHLGFWATPPTDTAFSRFVPETRVVSSFTATRVLPGIVSILYRRKLVIVQQDLDTVSVHPYDDSAHAMSGATSRQAGLRSLFNVEDLEDLLLPRVVYVAPGHASALGGTTLTILGHNFGISDPSPVVRIDGIACAASVWVSDAEIVCHGAAAKPSGTLLGIVGGQIELVGVPTAVLVPNMTKYVAQRDASHTSELCHTCHAPQEVWTWESSGTTVVSRFVQRVLGDTSVSTCGVGGSQCSAVLESGNRLLVAAMSFSPDGALTFTLADYENGDATFLLSVAYGAAVTQTRFRIVTEAVNNLPSATVANAGVVEACVGTPASSARAFYAVNVSAGGLVGNEAHQAVTVTVTPLAGDTLLASGTIPLIYPGSGLLTFELAEWAYGAQTFRIDVHDDGGLGTALPYTPASCGDASLAQDAVSCHWNSSRATNLTIRVPRSNTPPVFLFTSSMHVSPPGPGVSVVVQDGTGSHNVSAVVRVLEGTAAFRIDHFLEEMHAGSGIFQALEDGEQTLTFSLAFVGGQADLLLEPPTVFPNGSLSVHPVQHVAGAGGRVIFDLTVRDDGGVECGAVDTVTKRFAVDINYVNYPPSFSLNLMTVTRDENECSEERPCVVPGFATNMTAGPLEEWQNVSMVATVVGWEVLLCDGYALLPEDALFPLTNPSVTAAGALVFVSQPFCSGSVNVSIEMVDSGGTAHGGQNHSAAEMVTLVIASVDQPPRFTLPADAVFVTSADAGARAYPAFARNISAGAPRGRDILQSLSFSVSVLSAPDAFFLSPPAVDAGGRLTFAASGHVGVALCDLLLTDSGGLESPRSTPASRFNITVLNLNDPPQFALSQASIHVSEDEEGFGLEEIVVNITVGAEELQTLAFNVVQVGGALGLFSVPPHLECTAGNPGACTAASVALETAEDRFGHAVFALTLVDDGGRECLAPGRCGEDTSRSVNFTVTIAPENDKPSFALAAPDLLINANTWCIESNPPPYACGATIPGVAIPNNFRHERRRFASMIKMGDAYEIRGALTMNASDLPGHIFAVLAEACPAEPCSVQQGLFTVEAVNMSSASALFEVLPYIAVDGTLVFTLKEQAFGRAAFSVTLTDDGGRETPGVASAPHNFSITVSRVNNPPHFDLAATHLDVWPFALPTEMPLFFSNLSVGPPDEAAEQTFSIAIEAVRAADALLFAAGGLPYFRAEGNALVFAANAVPPNITVAVTLRVRMVDSGGTFRVAGAAAGWSEPRSGVVADDTMHRLVTLTFHGASAAAAASGAAWAPAEVAPAPGSSQALAPRMGHVAVEFQDRVLVIGGYQTAPDQARTVWSPSRRLLSEHSSLFLLSDVWALQPLPCPAAAAGRNAVCANSSQLVSHASFAGRHSHAATVLAGALYLAGGVTLDAAIARDVWRTSDGVKWTMLTDMAPWPARYSHSLVSVAGPERGEARGILILLGGASYTGAGDLFLNDVWTSSDGGAWVQAAQAAWSPRAGHAVAALNSAGATHLFLAGGYDATGVLNDVWGSRGGQTWEVVSGAAPWAARSGHALVSLQGRLLLVGGAASNLLDPDVDEVLRRDVWGSTDGSAWQQLSGGAPFAGRERLGAAVCRGQMALVVGGRGEAGNLGDVWTTPALPAAALPSVSYLDAQGRRTQTPLSSSGTEAFWNRRVTVD